MKSARMDEFAQRFGYPDYQAYNQAEIEKYYREHNMVRFELGDKVRLKDSPYEGTITECGNGATTFTDSKTCTEITLRHWTCSVLELVIDPQEGDVYRDREGREWIIMTNGREDNPVRVLCATLIGPWPAHYTRSTVGLFQEGSSVQKWAQAYGPVLVRRRGE